MVIYVIIALILAAVTIASDRDELDVALGLVGSVLWPLVVGGILSLLIVSLVSKGVSKALNRKSTS